MTTTTEAPMTESTPTLTEVLLGACASTNGATVAEIMAVTGQSKATTRSRIFTITKDGRLRAVPESNPRRYTSKV